MLTFLKNHWKKFALGLALFLVAFFILKKTLLKPEPEYETATATIKTLTQNLEVSGEVDAGQKATLTFQTSGKLGWIGVKEGDSVKKWHAVASLDKSILKKNLENALNDYMHQRWDFDQIREDNQVSTDNYDSYSFSNAIERAIEQEQFTLNKEVLDVEIQNLTNRLATLVSPIEGIVTKTHSSVAGVNVKSTDTIVEVVDPSSLYFEVEIDEEDISSIYVGQRTEITLEAFLDETISSEITWIDFSASTSDSGGTVFLARLTLPLTESVKYRLGMTGDAKITLTQKSETLSIPLEALETDDDREYVVIKTNTTTEERDVETGIETDDDIEILSGLAAGDEVVTGEKDK